MKAFGFTLAFLAAQALFNLVSAHGRHVWENWELRQYNELLAPPYPPAHTLYPIPYPSGPPPSVTYPGLYHTAFYIPPGPPDNMKKECRRKVTVDRLIDYNRFGMPSVRAVVVHYNPRTRFLEFRLILRDKHRLTGDGHALLDASGAMMAYKVMPPNCMFIKGDGLTYYEELTNMDNVVDVRVSLTPEMFAVFLPSKSVMPPYTVADPALVNETFVSAGPCRLITRVRVQPEAVVVEASPTELRVHMIATDGSLKLLRLHRWAECTCTPRILREIAYWKTEEGPDTVIVVQTGRTPGESDELKCYVQTLSHAMATSSLRSYGYEPHKSPLTGP